jgi:hypothetical protein
MHDGPFDPPSGENHRTARYSDSVTALIAIVPSSVIVLVLLVRFLSKAFTADDLTFLLEAQHALRDPLHPTACDRVLEGARVRLKPDRDWRGHGRPLLILSVPFGGSEWIAHTVQAPFLLAGSYCTARLAIRLGLKLWQARFACILLVAQRLTERPVTNVFVNTAR